MQNALDNGQKDEAMNQNDHSYRLAGAVFAVVNAALPGWVLTTVEKLVISVITAFFTGLAYMAGQYVFTKLKGSK